MQLPRVERTPVHATDDEAFVVVIRAPLSTSSFLPPMVPLESIEHIDGVDDALARRRRRKRQSGVGDTRDRVPHGDQTGSRIDVRPAQRESFANAQPRSQQVPRDLES